jgi:hypothetical protein
MSHPPYPKRCERTAMLDFYMIALALVSFAALFGYLHLCDWL